MSGLAATAAAVFVASLTGSLHCAGMCGGFVCVYAPPGTRSPWAHAAYNVGRLVTYVALGAVAGGVGAALDMAGSAAGISRIAAPVAGALMIGWGAVALWRAVGPERRRGSGPSLATSSGGTARLIAGILTRFRGRPPVVRATLMGLVSTLLPCGWLYGFATLAAGTGSPWRGMLVMLAFWAGTVPVMLGLGVSLHALAAPVRRRLPAITATAMIVIGVFWLAGRTGVVALPGHAGHDHDAAAAGPTTPGDADHTSDQGSVPDCCARPAPGTDD